MIGFDDSQMYGGQMMNRCDVDQIRGQNAEMTTQRSETTSSGKSSDKLKVDLWPLGLATRANLPDLLRVCVVLLLTLTALPATAAEGEWASEMNPAGDPRFSFVIDSDSDQPVGIELLVTTQRAKRTRTTSITCQAPRGADSALLYCRGLEPIPFEDTIKAQSEDYILVGAELPELTQKVAELGMSIVHLELGDAPEVENAEAAWLWGYWECRLEDSDHTACALGCIGHGGVDEISVSNVFGSNNPFAEPSCQVECTCNDDTEVDFPEDPPAQTMGF
jgi:hypothetical protein